MSTNTFEKEKPGQLVSDINEYCTDLIDIELPPRAGTRISTPFYTVKIVTVQEMNNYEDLQLKRIYPNMEMLTLLGGVQVLAIPLPQYHPKLTKLVFSSSDLSFEGEQSVERIIEQNGQINTLQVTLYPTINFLRRISQMANIKTFILTTRKVVRKQKSVAPIYCNYVRNFTLINDNDMDSDLIILPLVFNGLISFNYRYTGISPINNGWIQMVPNNKNLKDISMPDMQLSTQNLIDYSQRFPNLCSITFERSGLFHDDGFIPFLARTRITKITLINVALKFVNQLMNDVSLGRFRMKSVITNPIRERCTLWMEQESPNQGPPNQRSPNKKSLNQKSSNQKSSNQKSQRQKIFQFRQ